MLPWTRLGQRRQTPEIMDDPTIDAQRLDYALASIARLNSVACSARLVIAPILRLARAQRGRPFRVLDVATGAGDLPIALFRQARSAGIDLEIDACDLSPVSVAHAQRRAADAGIPVRVFQLDIFEHAIPAEYDVVTASLFLHHLQPESAVGVLRKMSAAARRMLIVSDLRRSRTGFLLAYAGSRLLTRSDVVRVDALRSVRAAYSVAELRAVAQRAGLEGARVTRRWPQRLVLQWIVASPTVDHPC